MKIGRSSVRAIGVLIAMCTAATAIAQTPDYSGQRITVIVPFSEGGGADTYSRLVAPYFEKYLPGNPKLLILNKPGGGGTSGAVYFEQTAKKDGTWVLAMATSTIVNYALGDPRAKFKLEEFVPIVLSPHGVTQYARKDLGLQDVADLKGRIEKLKSFPPEKLRFGGRTPTSGDLGQRIALTLLGVEVNSIWGLGGTGQMVIGFERGEFTLCSETTQTLVNNRKHLLEDGTAVPLYTFGSYDESGKLSRDPMLPDAPNFVEAYRAAYGAEPSGDGYEALKAIMIISTAFSKSWNLPAGTDPAVAKVWRDAAQKMVEDPDYQAKASERFGPYRQIIGEAVVPIMKEAVTISPNAKKWIARYLKVRYDVDLAGGKFD
jgi:tripartite-type tricarboxylate transporter receptor subunit TctC